MLLHGLIVSIEWETIIGRVVRVVELYLNIEDANGSYDRPYDKYEEYAGFADRRQKLWRKFVA